MARVLVTGGSGNFGVACVRHLVDAGCLDYLAQVGEVGLHEARAQDLLAPLVDGDHITAVRRLAGASSLLSRSTRTSRRGGPPGTGSGTSTGSSTRWWTSSRPSRLAASPSLPSRRVCVSSASWTRWSAALLSGARGPRSRRRSDMAARSLTLFTGQWADLPFEGVARPASAWGFDGLAIVRWGDHLDPWRSAEDGAYVPGQARPARAITSEGVGYLQPPRWPGHVRRPDRSTASGHALRPHLGRRGAGPAAPGLHGMSTGKESHNEARR